MRLESDIMHYTETHKCFSKNATYSPKALQQYHKQTYETRPQARFFSP